MRAGSSHKGIGLDDPAYPLRLAVIATGSRERSRPGSDMFLVLRAETCAKAGCDAAALRAIQQTVAICQDTGARWAPRWQGPRPAWRRRMATMMRPAITRSVAAPASAQPRSRLGRARPVGPCR